MLLSSFRTTVMPGLIIAFVALSGRYISSIFGQKNYWVEAYEFYFLISFFQLFILHKNQTKNHTYMPPPFISVSPSFLHNISLFLVLVARTTQYVFNVKMVHVLCYFFTCQSFRAIIEQWSSRI
jgi:hypothetical protein